MSIEAKALVEIAIGAQVHEGPTAQALRALAEASGAAGAIGSPITTTYVGPNGSDLTGVRGDIGKPFLTIQKAIDSTLSGDIIDVSPKAGWAAYAEDLVVSAARRKLTIRGCEGVIVDSGVGPALSWSPVLAGSVLELLNVTLGSSAIAGLGIDGTGMAAPFTAQLRAIDCFFGDSTITSLAVVQLTDCICLDNLAIQDCQVAGVSGGSVTNGLTLGYDGAVADLDRDEYQIKGCVVGSLVLSGQVKVRFGTTSAVGGFTTSPALSSFFSAVPLRDYSPDLGLQGRFEDSVTISFPAVDLVGLANNQADLSHGEFLGTTANIAVDFSGSNAASIRRAQVLATNAVFRGRCRTGPEVDVDARMSQALAGFVASGTGTVDRSIENGFVAVVVPALPATLPVVISPPLPTSALGFYQVSVTLAVGGGPPNDVVVTGKTPAGYLLSSVVGAVVETGFTRA